MEGEATTVVSGGLDTLLDAATQLVEFSGDCLNIIIANPVYAFLFAGVVIGAGITVVKMFLRLTKKR